MLRIRCPAWLIPQSWVCHSVCIHLDRLPHVGSASCQVKRISPFSQEVCIMFRCTIFTLIVVLLAGCGGGSGGGMTMRPPADPPPPEMPQDDDQDDDQDQMTPPPRTPTDDNAPLLRFNPQTAGAEKQAPIVGYDLLSNDQLLGPQTRDPNPGPSWLRYGANQKNPPDFLSVGVMPRILGEWRAFNGFPAHNRGGKQFTSTGSAERDGLTIQYGTDEGYPWTDTVREYLDTMGITAESINRQAVVRMREGSTAEELDLTVRAMQAINSALPIEHRMRIEVGEKSFGEEPGPHEITVTFAPINKWPGWETTGASPVTGWARAVGGTLGAEVWIREPVVMRPKNPDADRLGTVIHEFLHALGFWSHVEPGIGVSPAHGVYAGEGSSLMEAGRPPPYGNGGALHPIDRAALLAAFTDPENLGAWSNESLQLYGRLPLGGTPLDFGATYRNGHATAWGLGEAPSSYLADNSQLTGTVTWDGLLLGFTPNARSLTGDAQIDVNLADLRGRAEFTNLETWAAGPGEQGTGIKWGDGDLGYTIAVEGNTFTQTGGDAGRVTGIFVGQSHDGATGTLERADLTGAFGARRQ